jgi:formylglycine-generating enzyme required for sulfatase activity
VKKIISFLLLITIIIVLSFSLISCGGGGGGGGSSPGGNSPGPSISPGTSPILPGEVNVTGGTFKMDQYTEYTTSQGHDVTLSSFIMGAYEVTNKEYCAFLNSVGNKNEGGSYWYNNPGGDLESGITGGPDPGTFSTVSGYENLPVTRVTWYGAVAYCNWLSEQTGLSKVYGDYVSDGSGRWGSTAQYFKPANSGYRLPAEAEWEYACRAGTTTDFYWGGSVSSLAHITDYPPEADNYCWSGNNSGGRVHDVGAKIANNWGLYDMEGNVSEWCTNFYYAYYSSTTYIVDGQVVNPEVYYPLGYFGPSDGCYTNGMGWTNDRETRGTNITDFTGTYFQASYRPSPSKPENSSERLGFRLVRR